MKLWQAAWDLSGFLLVWGEASTVTPVDDALDREWHPRAVPAEELSRVLSELEYEFTEETILVQLPSDSTGPVAPPRLRQYLPDLWQTLDEAEEPSGEDAHLALWTFPAVRLAPLEALRFLTSVAGELPEGIRLDDSVAFWREAVKLLLELLARGRYLPGLVRKENTWCSHWHILPTGDDDHRRLNVLVDSMPPVCRGIAVHGTSPRDRALKGPEPSALLEAFLSECADALIRAFLTRHSLLGEIEVDRLPGRLAIQARWLGSLTKADATVVAAEYDLMQLQQRLESWAGRLLSVSRQHHLSTSFHLRPPPPSALEGIDDTDAPWTVEFAVRSTSDGGQELPAQQLWQGAIGFLQHSEQTPEDIEQSFLRDLGSAVQAFPQLRRALKELHPWRIQLSTDEAYGFLKETSRLLEQLGFTVHLPSWWKQPQTQLGLELSVASNDTEPGFAGRGFLAAQELLDFSWTVSVGDQVLDLATFRKLVQTQTPLLRIGGNWVELEPQKLKRTLEFLERQSNRKKISFLEALRLGLGLEQQDDLLPVVGFEATGWIQRLLSSETQTLPKLKEPAGFTGSLRPYQRDGLSWLAFLSRLGIGGCLADDMGLGKTVQFLALLLHEREGALEHAPASVRPTLLVVPMSILANWFEEARRFAPQLRVYVHHGGSRLTGDAFLRLMQKIDLVITTYSLVHRDGQLMSAVEWGRIALDEAQNIKNLEAKQTQAVRVLTEHCMNQPSDAGICQRVALTGTPLQNHLEELWSIFDFLNPGFLGTVKDFRSR
ncbi:MAG: DEAD/DEAH box helicase, partial [Bdellovibrionales bacterium]|nr:DEAD/DEAH box helicase [Bdellovibrionales bacterium]